MLLHILASDEKHVAVVRHKSLLQSLPVRQMLLAVLTNFGEVTKNEMMQN